MAQNENQLLHYGVKGMRWGVRNDDPVNGAPPKLVAPDHKDYADNRKRSAQQMSNAELKRIIERSRLERDAKEASRTMFDRGAQQAKKLLGTSTTVIATALATPVILWAGKKLLAKVFGEKIISEIYRSSKK